MGRLQPPQGSGSGCKPDIYRSQIESWQCLQARWQYSELANPYAFCLHASFESAAEKLTITATTKVLQSKGSPQKRRLRSKKTATLLFCCITLLCVLPRSSGLEKSVISATCNTCCDRAGIQRRGDVNLQKLVLTDIAASCCQQPTSPCPSKAPTHEKNFAILTKCCKEVIAMVG